MVALLVSALALAAPLRHALVVGANDGGGVLEPLRYAERDAETMADVLVELGSFDEERVSVLYAPTAEELREALAHHAAIGELVDDDLFVFYYSGHADANGLRLGEDRYWFDALKHDMRSIDATVRIGLLDACRSGTITRLKGAALTNSLFDQRAGALQGEAWLTASSADEVAQESDRLRGGFFTHYLVSGLRGAADRDDGIVDLDELWRYTSERVVSKTGETAAGAQHPSREFDLAGAGHIPLADVRHATAGIRFPDSLMGQLAVFRLPDGIQVAELTKQAGYATSLALPPGRYRVRRREGDALYDITLTLADGSLLAVTDWGEPWTGELADARGDRLAHYVDLSRSWERKQKLGHSPGIAGVSSIAVPGAGQLYNGHVLKGLAYFVATSSLMAGTIVGSETRIAPTLWPLVGATLWGASVADATYNVHRREDKRPRRGVPLSASGSFSSDPTFPWHLGASADLMLRPGLSIGLDRVGVSTYRDRGWDMHAGSRLMVAGEGERVRPGAFLAFGVRHGRDQLDPLPQRTLESVTDRRLTRTVFGAGANLRYYVVPRYFTEVEGRWERDGEQQGWRAGVGLGVHLGR
ncbi:MAG: TM2 domain-containing membrane protein YozV [Myxococcota bacterium]